MLKVWRCRMHTKHPLSWLWRLRCTEVDSARRSQFARRLVWQVESENSVFGPCSWRSHFETRWSTAHNQHKVAWIFHTRWQTYFVWGAYHTCWSTERSPHDCADCWWTPYYPDRARCQLWRHDDTQTLRRARIRSSRRLRSRITARWPHSKVQSFVAHIRPKRLQRIRHCNERTVGNWRCKQRSLLRPLRQQNTQPKVRTDEITRAWALESFLDFFVV